MHRWKVGKHLNSRNRGQEGGAFDLRGDMFGGDLHGGVGGPFLLGRARRIETAIEGSRVRTYYSFTIIEETKRSCPKSGANCKRGNGKN